MFPNRYDISAAGHISAGEKPDNAAIREIKEEISLKIDKKGLIFIGNQRSKTKINENFTDNEISYLYLYQWEGDSSSLELQKEEVSNVKFVTLKYFKDNSTDSRIFAQHGKEYSNIIIREIEKRVNINSTQIL